MNKKPTKRRGNIRKYRNLTLHSDLELSVVKQLYRDRRTLKKTFDFSYESEILPYTIEGNYKPDFIINVPDKNKKIYVECKGYLDEPTKRKMLAVRRSHPDLDIRFLFQKDNKIRGGKMRYTEWAFRNNFDDAHVGTSVPVEWLVGEKVKRQ